MAIPTFTLDPVTFTRTTSEVRLPQSLTARTYSFIKLAELSPFKEEAINPKAPDEARRYRRNDDITFSTICSEFGISWGDEPIKNLTELRQKVASWIQKPESQSVSCYDSWENAQSFISNLPPDFDHSILPLIILDMLGQFDGVLLPMRGSNRMVYIEGSALYSENTFDGEKNVHTLEVTLVARLKTKNIPC